MDVWRATKRAQLRDEFADEVSLHNARSWDNLLERCLILFILCLYGFYLWSSRERRQQNCENPMALFSVSPNATARTSITKASSIINIHTGPFRIHGLGVGFGFRLRSLVWSPDVSKARTIVKTTQLAWAESEAEAVVSKRVTVRKLFGNRPTQNWRQKDARLSSAHAPCCISMELVYQAWVRCMSLRFAPPWERNSLGHSRAKCYFCPPPSVGKFRPIFQVFLFQIYGL